MTNPTPPLPEAPARPVRRPRRSRRSRRSLLAIPVALGLTAASALVWNASGAAFSATTNNAGNSWAAGSVSLSDDDTATAMFAAAGLVPGSTGTRCITVTYGGTITSAVTLYVSANTGAGLQPYLDLVIEEGTGGSFASCAGFTPSSTLFTGTVAGLVAANASYATGLGTWAPTAATQARTYRFTYTLNAATPDAQQGASATATLQWEARSS